MEVSSVQENNTAPAILLSDEPFSFINQGVMPVGRLLCDGSKF